MVSPKPTGNISTTAHLQAPFPDDVPTHPLLVIDYTLLKLGDEGEISKLWEAATRLGFW